MRHLRHCLPGLDHLVEEIRGVFETAVVGRRGGRKDAAAVFFRRELALCKLVEHGQAREHHGAEQDHRAPIVEAVREPTFVTLVQRLEPRIQPTRDLPLVVVILQQVRAHHRGEHQRDHAGNHHRAGERQRKLAEEHAGEAAEEADRQIDRDQRQRHRDHRRRHFARTQQRGIERLFACLDVPVHVLHDHDRVVHHQTDRNHHREQCQ